MGFEYHDVPLTDELQHALALATKADDEAMAKQFPDEADRAIAKSALDAVDREVARQWVEL